MIRTLLIFIWISIICPVAWADNYIFAEGFCVNEWMQITGNDRVDPVFENYGQTFCSCYTGRIKALNNDHMLITDNDYNHSGYNCVVTALYYEAATSFNNHGGQADPEQIQYQCKRIYNRVSSGLAGRINGEQADSLCQCGADQVSLVYNDEHISNDMYHAYLSRISQHCVSKVVGIQ